MAALSLLLLALLAFSARGQTNAPAAATAADAERHYQAGLDKQNQADLAAQKEDARKLFGEAVTEYQAAAQFQPRHYRARLCWAVCLAQLALLTPAPDARIRQFREASQRFAGAATCPEADAAVYEQWAILLRTHLYNALTDPADRVALLQETIAVCERGLPLASAPTPRAQLQRHLGSALMWSAEYTSDPAAQRRFLEQAIEHLRAANAVVAARQALYENNDLGTALLSLGRLTGDRALLREAATELSTALQFFPNQYDTFYNLAATYSLLGDLDQAAQNLSVAMDHDPDGEFHRLADTDPNLAPVRGTPAYTAALDRRRRRLAEQQAQETFRQALQAHQTAARVRDPAVALPLLRQVVDLCQQTVGLVPDHFRAQSLCAAALVRLYQLICQEPHSSRADQDRAFTAATDRFAAAGQLPEAEAALYLDWSSLLLKDRYPQLTDPADQERLLRDACQVIEAGVRRVRFSGLRGHLEAQWSTCLVRLAQLVSPASTNSAALYTAALKHFPAAVAADPVKRSASFYELWGIALLRAGQNSKDTRLLRQATERFLKSLELNPDNPLVHYNLACAYAQVHQPEQALRHLASSLETDPQDKLRAAAATDPDFDPLRNLDAFRRLLQPPRLRLLNERPTVSDK